MNTPLVSILIPNYNKAKYIRETLDSIIAQTYTNWECIIIDDQSTDNSWEILQEYAAKDSRFQIHKRPAHLLKGGNACRNYAFELSKGDYIQWFDSDDLMFLNSLQNRLEAITQGDYDFIVYNGILWNGLDSNALLVSDWKGGNVYEAFLNFEPIWLTQSTMINKRIIDKYNLKWDENVPFYQDVLYNLELLSLTKKYAITNEVDWVWYVTNGNGLGNRTKKINTYVENFNLCNSFYLCVKNNKDVYLILKNFCFERIYRLIKSNNREIKDLSPLLAYLDFFIVKNISLNILERLHILFIKIIIYSFSNNIRIGKSLFFRFFKYHINMKKKSFSFDHFLTKRVALKSLNSFEF